MLLLHSTTIIRELQMESLSLPPTTNVISGVVGIGVAKERQND